MPDDATVVADDAQGPDLTKFTKAELIEAVSMWRERAIRASSERGERSGATPVDLALSISALVELHRAGLHDGVGDGRYLATARALGDELVTQVTPSR